MKKGYWLLGSCVAAALTVAACGDDEGDNGGGGEAGSDAGTGGESGSATTGGSGGRGGGGSSNGGSGAVGGSNGGAGEGGTGEGGAGEGGAGGENSGGRGDPSGGTGGLSAGLGGMTAGSGGARAGSGGATAGGGAGTAGAGGSGGTCTQVSPSSAWNYGNGNLPGSYAYFAAFLQPNVGGPDADNFFFGFYDNPGDGELTGIFELGQGHDANYATCSRCFFVLADTTDFFATSGTLVISSDSTPMAGIIHATLTDATFVEVTIDDVTSESTPVPNGLCVRVSAMAFSLGS